MSSTDEEIDLFKQKYMEKRKQTKNKKKKVPTVRPPSDSDESDNSESDELDEDEEDTNIQDTSSDDSEMDYESSEVQRKMTKQSSGDVMDVVEETYPKKSRGKKKDMKHKVSRTIGEQPPFNESDSEPDTIKKKKMKEPVTSNVNEEIEGDEYTAIREELSHMSFEELQKLRDKLGIKVYNQVMRGGKDKPQKSVAKQTFSRENKNRPMEMSSKRPVSIYREVIQVKKKVIRDPRFDDMSGTFNESIFRSSYAFVNKIKEKEKEKLSKKLKKTKNEEKKQELKFLINRMSQQESAEQQKKRRKELEKEWKKKELKQVQEGKNPYFLKKGDLRKLELAERFKELKKTGKLDKYLGKKRKKNASKEKKKLPNS